MKAFKLAIAATTLLTGLSAHAGFWKEIGKIVDAIPSSSSTSSRDYDRDRGRDHGRDYDRDRNDDRDRRDREDRDRRDREERDRRDRDRNRDSDRGGGRGGQPPANNCAKVTSDVQSMREEFAQYQAMMNQAGDECGTGWICKSEYQAAYDVALRHLQDAERLRESVCR